MSRADEQAFPVAGMQAPNDNFIWPTSGLTIREHFAAMAMQGLLTRSHLETNSQSAVAALAVTYADALIAELAKQAVPPANEALEVLRALVTAKHIDLGDLVYKVRESEGEGWDGPAVTAWSEAVTRAKKLVQP